MAPAAQDFTQARRPMSIERLLVGEFSKRELIYKRSPQRRLGGSLDDVEVDHGAEVGQRLPDRRNQHALDLNELKIVNAAALVVERTS